MKDYKYTTISLVFLLLFAVAGVNAGREREISKTFEKKDRVDISTVSGDCIVEKSESDKIEVYVVYRVSPSDNYEPRFKETDNKLRLSEKFFGSSSGYSIWTITVPEDTEIRFSSASGEFRASDLKADISVETASGNIELEDCEGEFDLETASGDVELRNVSGDIHAGTASGDVLGENLSGVISLGTASGDIELNESKGEIELQAASGDIEAVDVVIEGWSAFDVASGSVDVLLAESAAHDLMISSASGRAELNYNGNPIEGYFEFVAREDRGRIYSPFEFDDEDGFRESGRRYLRKSFTKGSDTPRIAIETASGKAVLAER